MCRVIAQRGPASEEFRPNPLRPTLTTYHSTHYSHLCTDDIIKANKAKAKNNNKGAGQSKKPSTPGSATAASAGSGKKKRNKKAGGGGGSTPMSVDKVSSKVIQSVGAGKAKRAAKADQKRGINTTGVATKQAIKKAVTKVAVGALLKKNTPKQRPNVKKGTPVSGLKISFKTADLAKTTEKQTAAQIKAALAKTGRVVTLGGGGKGKGKGKK